MFTVKVLVPLSVFTLGIACPAFGQMQGGPGIGGQNRGQNAMVQGEIARIDDRSLTVTTPSGDSVQFTRTALTPFVKETVADQGELTQGVTVVVVGQSTGQQTMAPTMIRIVDKMEDASGPPRQGGSAAQRGGMAAGGQARGGGDRMTSGPVIGTITGRNPLTIKGTSGEMTVVEITSGTRILRETAVEPAVIVSGTRVMVFAPQRPGSASREAKRIIVLSQDEPDAMRQRLPAAGTTDVSKTIGYVGCSLTLGAVDGYANLGGTNFWPDKEAAGSYPGGSVSSWLDQMKNRNAANDRWGTFERLLSKYPRTDKVLWHLCSDKDRNPTYQETLEVLEAIKKKTAATIYVTASPIKDLPCAPDDNRCPKILRTYADQMIRGGLVERGPELKSLQENEIGYDGHPNPAGMKIWGGDLRDFFTTMR